MAAGNGRQEVVVMRLLISAYLIRIYKHRNLIRSYATYGKKNEFEQLTYARPVVGKKKKGKRCLDTYKQALGKGIIKPVMIFSAVCASFVALFFFPSS